MGILGVLALARHRGILSEVKPVIKELAEKGFWVSRRIPERFLEDIGEL